MGESDDLDDGSGEAITAEGLEALKAEIEQLEGEGRETMAARLKTARELGDLKENAEYHIAKEDQAHLETRIRDLKERLANAVVTEGTGSSQHLRDREVAIVQVGIVEPPVDLAEGAAAAGTVAGGHGLAALEELEAAHAEGGSEALDRFLLPADSGLQHWPLVHFSEHSAYYWLHGQPVRAPEAPKFGMVRVQDHNGRFIGIGEVSEDGRIAPRRLIRSE